MRIAEKVRMEKPMMNVRIAPCNQSGETVMGRRLVMHDDPDRGRIFIFAGARVAKDEPSRHRPWRDDLHPVESPGRLAGPPSSAGGTRFAARSSDRTDVRSGRCEP